MRPVRFVFPRGRPARPVGSLRQLADRTIVWTHVQFAVTEFGSPLIAMDWGAVVRGLSLADKS
jgi:hypothetical protein